ncbi:AfsR/SARP family transcriptional regulator [Planobispora takensis]|uniref:AfsR/SARP family transcriptional regulator n=1 Tax=Planobispora takensis TaxID=1367882 RepID=UPI001944103D|nr:AfsR/SARP family transcriptional regulator [Planobispora takensis]
MRTGTTDETTFAVLGPLQARRGGGPLPLGPFKQRALLAALLCRANRVVSTGTLIEALWDDDPPRTAHKSLQVYVATLRKEVLGPATRGHLTHSPPGYLLGMRPDQLDALDFAHRVDEGRAMARRGETRSAARTLRGALELWRGAPLPDLTVMPLIAAEVAALEDRRAGAFEDWAELELELGNHTGLPAPIREQVERHPLRERLRSAQMLTLYRCGRQTEALAVYEEVRQTLARELGLQPSPVLERLYRDLLAGDPALTAPAVPEPVALTGPPGEPPEAAAPGRPDRGAPALLPRDLPDFTGRAGPLREVLAGLRVTRPGSGPVTVVSGLHGCGKTALAVHAAHRLRGRFPDGQIFVRLRDSGDRARPVRDVLAELLRATGHGGRLPRTTEDRAALYRTGLAERRMLLVLDDAPGEHAVRPLLPGAGANGVLVTSRRRLGALESARHVELGELPAAEAVELLAGIAGPERVADDPAAAERIARACCGLPMAVRIAGARLAAQRHMALGWYAGWLGDARVLVEELTHGGGDLALRTCDAVYRHELDQTAWSAFLHMAAAGAGPFTLTRIAVLLGLPVRETARIIDRLIDVALVVTVAGAREAAPSYRVPCWPRLSARGVPAEQAPRPREARPA